MSKRRQDGLKLEDHMRLLYSFSLDDISEAEIAMSARVVRMGIREAKAGDTSWLKLDIWNIALVFRALEDVGKIDAPKAYAALRAYALFIIEKCPGMRDELTSMLSPFCDISTAPMFH